MCCAPLHLDDDFNSLLAYGQGSGHQKRSEELARDTSAEIDLSQQPLSQQALQAY